MRTRTFFNEQETQVVNKSLFKVQLINGQSVLENHTQSSQFLPKTTVKNFLPKRSQSINRFTSRSKKNERPLDGMYLHGTKLSVWPFKEEKILETCPDEVQQEPGRYKNLERLLKPEKIQTKERTNMRFFKNTEFNEKNTEWKNLPEDFKKLPLFQTIYLKKKSEALQLIHNSQITSNFKPHPKAAQTFYPLKPSENKDNKEIISNNLNLICEYEPKYYGIETIGYQNYKCKKIVSRSTRERSTSINKQIELKMEPQLQEISNVKKNSKDFDGLNQGESNEITRKDLKRQKSLGLKPVTSSTMTDKFDSKERQSVIAEAASVLEFAHENENDLINHKKTRVKLARENKLHNERQKSPLFDNPIFEGSKTPLFERKKNHSLKKLVSNGSEKYYIKEWKHEFDELCAKSQKWFENSKNKESFENNNQNESHNSFNNAIPKEPAIYLKVFIDNQELFSKQKEPINNRIIYGLGVNCDNQYSQINWEKFCQFKRLLITKEASRSDMVDFMFKVWIILLVFN